MIEKIKMKDAIGENKHESISYKPSEAKGNNGANFRQVFLDVNSQQNKKEDDINKSEYNEILSDLFDMMSMMS